MLTLYVIYDHPKDHPNHWVVRCQMIPSTPGAAPIFDEHCYLFDTLEQARASLPVGLACFSRCDGDDPVIHETWL